MKKNPRRFLALSMVAAATFIHPVALMAEAKATPAAADWKALEEKATPPQPPAEWRENQPSREVIEAWRTKETARLIAIAEEARAFYTRHGADPNAQKARTVERELLEMAARANNADAQKRLDELEAATLKNVDLSQNERFQIRAKQVLRGAKTAQDVEVGARELMVEFPDEPGVYQLLLMVARSSTDVDQSRSIAEEIIKSKAAPEVKTAAEGILKKLEAVGKPFDLSFTALDGRPVDLKKMAGKVVLIDFWATWCQPCVVGIPELKEVYKKLHDKGFEVIGISLDNDKAALEKFIKENDLPWPQYFDGRGFETELATKNGINAIPALWLVDKKGILREINAREGLEEKVQNLLNEPSE